jgi:hypothetical protein
MLNNLTSEKLARLPRGDLIKIASCVEELARRRSLDSNPFKHANDPVAWIKEYLPITLPKYWLRLLEKIRDGERKIAVHGPHGIGKTVFAAIIVLWGGSTSNDCKVITTASAWRQLERYLWPEIHKWLPRVSWAKIGRHPEARSLGIRFGKTSEAFAATTDDPETIEGAHADRIIYIFDEAKAIELKIWEAAEGAFASPGDHLHLALSTPGDCSGVFYNICSRAKGYERWLVKHVSVFEAIRAGRMTLAWAKEKRASWGRNNPVYVNRVLGRFAKTGGNSIIPLAWVEQAVARWHAWNDSNASHEGAFVIGADTAGQGADKTVFAFRYGRVLSHFERSDKSRPMDVAGRLKVLMTGDGLVNIDVSFGEGAGTADRLKEFPECEDRVRGVCFGAGTDRKDKTGYMGFANVRAALWWNMRELLDPDSKFGICLPDDPLLIGDLTAPTIRRVLSDGRMVIESKEDIKARLGRSTDDGDACCLAFWDDEDFITKPDLYAR